MKEKDAPRFLSWAATSGRLVLGAVFLYAGIIKAAAPAEGFAYAIESYKVVPSWLALAIAHALPWGEIALGALLLAGVYLRLALAATGALLFVFESLLLSAIIRKIPVSSCGCFGSALIMSPGTEFLVNLLLAATTLLAWKDLTANR